MMSYLQSLANAVLASEPPTGKRQVKKAYVISHVVMDYYRFSENLAVRLTKDEAKLLSEHWANYYGVPILPLKESLKSKEDHIIIEEFNT